MVDTLHPPVEVIASWPTPNYIDPPQHGPGIIYLFAILGTLSVVIVTSRIYARLWITKAPGIDDVLIVIALTLTLVLGSLIVVGHDKLQSGRHIWDIDPNLFSKHRLNLWISQWFYLYSSATIKISVLLFYRRLSVSFTKGFLWAVYAGMAYTVIVWLAFSLYLLLICSPVWSYWESYDFRWRATHNFNCGTETVSLPMSAALNAFGDGYSTLLPMLLIEQTSQPIRQRLALYGLFALGFLAMGAGIARTVFLYQILNVYWDNSWRLTYMWSASLIELFLAIVAASAPALKPLFKQFFNKTASAINSSKRRSGSVPLSSIEQQQQQPSSSPPEQWRHGTSPTSTQLSEDASSHDFEKAIITTTPPHHHSRTKSFPMGSWIEFDDSHGHELERIETETETETEREHAGTRGIRPHPLRSYPPNENYNWKEVEMGNAV